MLLTPTVMMLILASIPLFNILPDMLSEWASDRPPSRNASFDRASQQRSSTAAILAAAQGDLGV